MIRIFVGAFLAVVFIGGLGLIALAAGGSRSLDAYLVLASLLFAIGIHKDEFAGVCGNRADRLERELELFFPISKQMLDMLGRNREEKFEVFAIV